MVQSAPDSGWIAAPWTLRWPKLQMPSFDPRLADERVVRRHRPVGAQPHHLAVAGGEVLGQHPLGRARMLAGGDEQVPILVEGQARAVVHRRRRRRRLHEDVGRPLDRPAVVGEPAARRGGGAHPAAERLGIGPIDHPVLGELRPDRHVEQAALLPGMNGRQPGERLGHRAVAADDAHAARSLGHQHRPVGQQRHAPRMLEPAGELGDLQGDAGSRLGGTGLFRKRRQQRGGIARPLRHRVFLGAGGGHPGQRRGHGQRCDAKGRSHAHLLEYRSRRQHRSLKRRSVTPT